MNFGEISTMQCRIMGRRRFSLSALALCFVLLAGGCASTAPGGESGKNSIESLLKDADTELAAGQHDKAISVLNYAAKEHPANMMPWLKMANIWFEKGNYPSSILAANEVLQRDSANQEAKSLLVVAGLRVAAANVTGLRPSGSVNMGTRIEAENLTNSLRGALGEKVLVPPAETKVTSSSPRSKAKSSVTTSPGVAAAARSVSQSSGSADPFKSLK